MLKKLLATLAVFATLTLFNTAMAESVYRHVVCFKWKKGTTEAQIKEAATAFKGLQKEIKEIKAFEWGKECSPEPFAQEMNHCFLLTFKNKEDFMVYLKHEKHKAFVEKFLPIIEKPIVVDYQTEE